MKAKQYFVNIVIIRPIGNCNQSLIDYTATCEACWES